MNFGTRKTTVITRTFAILLVALYAPFAAAAQESFPAPFGLSWGMSEESLQAIGFKKVDEGGGLTLMTSVTVPKAWSNGETYFVATYESRLVKATAQSRNFTDDIYGTEGKRVYKELKSLLSNKYGAPPREAEWVGLELYDDADEFYQCLDYSGCGAWFSLFEFQNGAIAVEIKGIRRGVGYVSIGYEGPSFSEALREIKRKEAESDTDAL